ncbi:hypothetical protein [Bifidobacterium sp. ESL0745]|uniref:hypothetical protein n=1 Tax=Bifidobacterium sp. ESL0745 TaxID=2983226 RepID=UPI0023FA3CFE|nr:hypothetical protein [Bifidobacterium sp. ESL0745]MDF7664770.1 hypothetical protein [Bifidobacterium sp. ESL0745]
MALSSLPALVSCAPDNMIAGDTQSVSGHVTHDSRDKSDLLIGVVTAGDENLDQTVIEAFEKVDIKAIYAAAPDGGVPDPNQSFTDMTRRPVSAFVVSGLDMRGNRANGWNQAFRTAHDAGIPVILVDAVRSDTKLYAEALRIVPPGGDNGTVSFADAVQLAINDNPHPKMMSVTLP